MIRIVLILMVLLIGGVSSSSGQSIFDVYHKDEPKEETKANVEDKQEGQFKDPLLEELDNPFEVSHIPLRKNQELKHIGRQRQQKSTVKSQELKAISPLTTILFSAFGLAIILFNYRGLFRDIVQSILNKNFMQSFKQKALSIYASSFIGLYIIFFLNAGLFTVLAYQMLSKAQTNLPLVYTILVFPVVYVIRHLSLFVFGWIFELQNEAASFSFIIALLNICLGLCLIPMNLFIAFAPPVIAKILVFIVLLLFVLSFIIRYARGFLIGGNYILSHTFLFFLYFCTFEIAPVLIILHLLGYYG